VDRRREWALPANAASDKLAPRKLKRSVVVRCCAWLFVLSPSFYQTLQTHNCKQNGPLEYQCAWQPEKQRPKRPQAKPVKQHDRQGSSHDRQKPISHQFKQCGARPLHGSPRTIKTGPRRIRDVNRDTGNAVANRRWLRLLVSHWVSVLKKYRRRTANAIGIKRMPKAITGYHPAYAPNPAVK